MTGALTSEYDMPRAQKQRLLISFALSLIAILVLASSLPGMQLKAGKAFPGGDPSTSGAAPETQQANSKIPSASLLQGAFALLFVVMLFSVAARLALRVDLKKVSGPAALLLLLLLLLIILPRLTPAEAVPPATDLLNLEATPEAEIVVTPLGTPPPAFTWLVLGLLVMGAGAILAALLGRKKPPAPMDEIKQEARAAVDALRTGQEFGDVIVRCYLRMVEILQEEHGLQRGESMTAREFEGLLKARGVPDLPVHRLTGLFEKSRYGRLPAGEQDQRLGIESLEQIVQFSRGGKGQAQ